MAISTVFIVATFRRYSQQFQQKLCLPGDEWWRDGTHTAAEQNVLCAPPLPTSLPSHRCARSALQNVSVQCTVRLAAAEVECACPSPTRMGETAPRRRCKQDHRPIAFSGKRWSAGRLLPSPVQYPHTCRPGFLAAEKFWVVFCQTAVGCLCGSETGAQPSVVWRVDGRPVGPHTAFTGSQESHITRPAVAGGTRGGVGWPQNADRSVPSAC